MNTPPRIKRHAPTYPTGGLMGSDTGSASGSLEDSNIAALIGKIAAAFVHLESQMAHVLANLAGTDFTTAGYMLRAVKSPRGRIELMEALLQKAPAGLSRGAEWDAMLREFSRLNSRRNDFIHAHWWSGADGTTWASIWDDHGLTPFSARRIEATELSKLLTDIGVAQMALLNLVHGQSGE